MNKGARGPLVVDLDHLSKKKGTGTMPVPLKAVQMTETSLVLRPLIAVAFSGLIAASRHPPAVESLARGANSG